VFKAQQTIYFLHGFLVHGSTLELWVFDRSGAYSSEKFDLLQRSNLLIYTLCAYAWMSDEEAGFKSFVKHCEPKNVSYVEFDQGSKFYLRPVLIAAPSYIVGLGTTCLAASSSPSTAAESDTVVKFSWRDDAATHAELRLLELTRKRNVKDVIHVLGKQGLVSIADPVTDCGFLNPSSTGHCRAS